MTSGLNHMPLGRHLASILGICACTGLFVMAPAKAGEFKLGNTTAFVTGRVTYGTGIRADTEDASQISRNNGNAIGINATATGGANSDDGNLNYRRGDRVSTVLKGVAAFGLKQGDAGVLVRAKAWRDFALLDDNVPWGNIPNNYVANQPLSDQGFSSLTQFSGIAITDAYVYNSFLVGDKSLYLKLGNQTIPWGGSARIAGGLSAFQPRDLAAATRPGAVAEETTVAVPAMFGRLGISDKFSVEGYYQFRFRPTELPGCGTFFAGSDYISDGCDKIFVGAPAGSDRFRLAAGAYMKRAPTQAVSNSGQYGIGMTYKLASLDTLLGAYFSRYHSTTPVPDAVKTIRSAGAPLIAGDPGGQNTQYFTSYYEGVRVVALNFESKIRPRLTAYGELSYRPNQPVILNAGDILAATISNTAATPLRADMAALPLGGILRSADRFKTLQLQMGAGGQLPGILGAATLSYGGEVAIKHIFDLPDVAVRRYGRPDVFGQGPVNGVCTPGSPDVSKQCSSDGYVTRNAWGYVLGASLRYPNAFSGADLNPSVAFTHNVKGWSYDGIFSEGRQSLTLGLSGTYLKKYSAMISYTALWGGRYSTIKDRDLLTLSAGYSF